MSLGVYEAKHKVLREALHGALLATVDSRYGVDGIGSVQGRASAALYALLCDHEIDRRGRCRCCRRRGAVVLARRRTCRVFVTACFYLYQPDDVLLFHLGRELEQPIRAPGSVADPDATQEQELPGVAADPVDPGTQRLDSPAVSPRSAPGGSPRVRRPDPDHGEAGEPPRTRPRRAPPPGHQAHPLSGGRSLVVTADATWQV